ncbi:MAG: HD domain-containing protein [Bacteroidales bacterium]|nr:HD domain-containing protein [Bacteroidales bacterium]HOY39023.1 HD domain-containing protein [Bacteroidales bacterium]HQP03164.1 HD domain-containing protein [Bacteroidales bacterium]
MNAIQREAVGRLREHLAPLFASENSGHDFMHLLRVEKMAMHLAFPNGADPFICSLAALLHEHDDNKLTHITGGKDEAVRLLMITVENENIRNHVLEIISSLSYKGASVETPMKTIEGMCVQDADRLDAMGAVGIARTFCFCGARNQPIHDPGISPVNHKDEDDYHKAKGTGINHFYEKLLIIKDRMNTEEAKRIANIRHNFMEEYLDRFLKECEGIQ